MARVGSVLTGLVLAMVLAAPLNETNRSHASAQDNGRDKRFDCGYDSQGAANEWVNHALHALRLSTQVDSTTLAAAQAAAPRVEDSGDIAVIEDNGTIVIPPSKFRLKNQSLLLTPDTDGYRISSADIPFNDDFGSRLEDFLGADNKPADADNGYRDITLAGAQFPFFGNYYDTIYVGTNGYITFTQGDTTARISPAALASELPRIAPLWADLEFVDSGGIYYNRLEGRHVITWNRGGQPLYSGVSTFQAVLYDDGRIAFVYGKVKAQAALVGISPGHSALDPQPITLSDPPAEKLTGPFFETFAKEKRLDLPALLRAFYRGHSDSFDTAFVWTDFDYDNGVGIARSFNVRNGISGIGLRILDRGSAYGSPARLSTIITMGNESNWPKDPDTLTAGLNSAVCIVCHELGHRWLAYVHFDAGHDSRDDLLGRENAHWSFLADTRTSEDGSRSSLMEGNAWRDTGAGTFTTIETAVNYFTALDQYLMGLRPARDVGEIPYLDTGTQLKEFLRTKSPVSGFSMSAVRTTTSVAQIIEREGPRVPDAASAPKAFRAAFIVLSEQGSAPAQTTLNTISHYRDSLVSYFSLATEGRGSLDASLK